MLIQNKPDIFKVKFNTSKTDITKQLFYDNNNTILDIINKYLRIQLASDVLPHSRNIVSKVLYKYNITQSDLSKYIYMLKQFNYKNKNILVCSANLNHIASLEFIREHYNYPINYNGILFEKYTRFSQHLHNNLNQFNKVYPKRNISIYNNNINQLSDLDYILINNKYDYIILDTFNTNNEIYKYNIYSNEYIIYSNKLFLETLIINTYILLHNLQKNGNCIILCRLPYDSTLLELLYFISTKFKSIKFIKCINNLSLTIYIICNDFIELLPKDLDLINNIYNKFRKNYPENINKKSLDTLLNKSINNIFTIKNKNQYLLFIEKYNIFANEIIQTINNIIEEAIYLSNEIKANNKNSINFYKQKYIADIIALGKTIGIELLPRLQERIFQDNFGKTILTNMYSYDNFIHYKFIKHPCPVFKLHINLDHQLPIFENIVNKFNLAGRIIDTRDIKDYNNIKFKVRYYEKTLTKYIENNYTHNHKISRAFLKSYEILEITQIINPNLKTLNVFDLCSFPGAFIISINHYIHTKTNIENFNWIAQSLHPKTKFQDKRGFSDEFKLMKKFPDRWDFGKTKTGDITDIDNLIYYRNTYKDTNLHLVLGDCGLAFVCEEDSLSDILHVSQIIAMLSILGKGGNFALKLYLPALTPIYISLFYLLYTRFRGLQFYKSFQNNWSPEYYICGTNYLDPINDTEFNELLDLLKNFNVNNSIIPLRKISEEFILQLDHIFNELINNFKMAIKRVIYFVDNVSDMSKNDIDKLYKSISNKNREWASIFNIKKIDKKYLIH